MKIYQTENKGINPIYQNSGSSETSNKYGFISSEKIIKRFEAQGFTLDGVSYADSKNSKNTGFQKHIMIFSRPDLLIDENNKMQILALNSHDGKNSLRLNVGVFRIVCANGLVAGDSLLERRVRHTLNFDEKLTESLNYIICNASKVRDDVLRMKNTELTLEQTQDYLVKMAKLRLENVENLRSVNLATLDRVRREGDKGQDLYTFFNRVQETIINGGLKYTNEVPLLDANKNEVFTNDGDQVFKERKNTTRKIKEFKKTIELNKTLWNEAVKLAA